MPPALIVKKYQYNNNERVWEEGGYFEMFTVFFGLFFLKRLKVFPGYEGMALEWGTKVRGYIVCQGCVKGVSRVCQRYMVG